MRNLVLKADELWTFFNKQGQSHFAWIAQSICCVSRGLLVVILQMGNNWNFKFFTVVVF